MWQKDHWASLASPRCHAPEEGKALDDDGPQSLRSCHSHDNLQPWSIRFQCERKLCCMNQVPNEAVFKVKETTMSELHNSMSCLWIKIRFFRSSVQRDQRIGQYVEPSP